MQIDVDDARYAIVVRAFTIRLVASIAAVLHRRSILDLRSMRPEDVDLVYELCFAVGARIEDHGGFEADGETWVAHCLFAHQPKDPATLLASWRRLGLHGIEDDALDAGIQEALRRLS